MTGAQQRAALQRQIWQIANDVRGAVDGWDFKQYVLGTLFYRFISENFASYIEAGDESVRYAELPDSIVTPEIKDDAIKTKGYFIYPSQLFANIAKDANTNERSPNVVEIGERGGDVGFIESLLSDLFDSRSDRPEVELRLGHPLM